MKTYIVDKKEILIDDEDFHLMDSFNWKLDNKGYVVYYTHETKIRLHRLLLKVTKFEDQVDHINGNKLDNQKENLRICSNQENSFNSGKRPGWGNSGMYSKYKGVYWDKKSLKWRIGICFNYKIYNILMSDSQEICAYAYNFAATLLAKKFAFINKLDKELSEQEKEYVEEKVKEKLNL